MRNQLLMCNMGASVDEIKKVLSSIKKAGLASGVAGVDEAAAAMAVAPPAETAAEVGAAEGTQPAAQNGTNVAPQEWVYPDSIELIERAGERLGAPGDDCDQGELEKCVTSSDVSHVDTVIERAKSVGLDVAERWYITGGADAFAAASQKQAVLAEGTMGLDESKAETSQQLEFLMSQLKIKA